MERVWGKAFCNFTRGLSMGLVPGRATDFSLWAPCGGEKAEIDASKGRNEGEVIGSIEMLKRNMPGGTGNWRPLLHPRGKPLWEKRERSEGNSSGHGTWKPKDEEELGEGSFDTGEGSNTGERALKWKKNNLQGIFLYNLVRKPIGEQHDY